MTSALMEEIRNEVIDRFILRGNKLCEMRNKQNIPHTTYTSYKRPGDKLPQPTSRPNSDVLSMIIIQPNKNRPLGIFRISSPIRGFTMTSDEEDEEKKTFSFSSNGALNETQDETRRKPFYFIPRFGFLLRIFGVAFARHKSYFSDIRR